MYKQQAINPNNLVCFIKKSHPNNRAAFLLNLWKQNDYATRFTPFCFSHIIITFALRSLNHRDNGSTMFVIMSSTN